MSCILTSQIFSTILECLMFSFFGIQAPAGSPSGKRNSKASPANSERTPKRIKGVKKGWCWRPHIITQPLERETGARDSLGPAVGHLTYITYTEPTQPLSHLVSPEGIKKHSAKRHWLEHNSLFPCIAPCIPFALLLLPLRLVPVAGMSEILFCPESRFWRWENWMLNHILHKKVRERHFWGLFAFV